MPSKQKGLKNTSKGPKGHPQEGSSLNLLRVAANKANPDIRKYVLKTLKVDNSESWLSHPEIPTAQEIMGQTGAIDLDDGTIDLPTNQIDGPWESPKAYLNAHYELLREDTVASLRDAVALVRDEPKMTDTNEVCIYEKVYITGITLSTKGVATKISFSTSRAGKNIVWEYTSRLITGSMVALSPADDCFQTQCLVAVVAARPLEQLNNRPRQIDIFFAESNNAPFDPQQEWIMVQARSGYLESSRHTMKTLQVMSKESFPFSEHLCDLKTDIGHPTYIGENPQMKLFDNKYADILSDWPSEPQNNLDTSQWEALHQILTKRLAIIQGPPGTGKTHVSVSALRLYLSNWKEGDPPIVIAAHTNHALDQLLNHISAFVPDYIRLGGRSLDENVKKRTLFEVKELLSPFSAEELCDPLPGTFFLKHGAITNGQYRLLCEGAGGWEGSCTEPMSIWLGDSFGKHRVTYNDESFEQEDDEADMEYEQLKELEQERDYLDDELEALNGYFLPLHEPFIGLEDSNEPEETEADMGDLWQIPPSRRGHIYNKLRQRAKNNLLLSFRVNVQQHNAVATERQIGKWEYDYVVLKDAKVIGMTTTGLSKYRALVSALKPKIIMIEEAAETIEAPITAACVESLEHLILVGDHKQLQGSCSVRELESPPYNLNVSMFERLVRNGVDFRTMTLQRRMVPEIRRLLTPIYDNIEDHETVNKLAKVPAMGEVRAFFFSHHWRENSDSLFSKYNHNEALMVATFFLYLVLAGLDSAHITVLTFYNGQRKKILSLLKSNKHLQGRHLKVYTVDSYQGEENEVVLLSLVRSNDQNGIGFLKIENRVCVALSRARRGFYMFGNAEHLASESPLWMKVISVIGSGNATTTCIARYIQLTCEKHGNKEFVEMPQDLVELTGGCSVPCTQTLDCGHTCALRCHNFDHSQIECQATCERTLSCGHTCGMTCSAETCVCSVCGHWAMNPKFPGQKTVLSQTNASQQAKPITQPSVAPSTTYAEKAKAHVTAYQQFANGGAKEHDRQIAETMQAQRAQEILARLDAEAEASLFADDELDESEAAVSTEESAGGILSDAEKESSSTSNSNNSDTPTRRRFVETFDPSKGLKELTISSNEMTLIDLCD
ncbi:DEAD box helicase involved in nonsense mediated decay, putative [Talaromyces stipitatus ATCC 10500]|uniref:DEAD box helicase involved in nonsense mediated decay, putative n=1 Tax=Talaromyces stipitatus (strain ATCC 10500 / CBS 375.48 / QM 6759 / NRRL 1006) TaxID=441959 RepID=B8MD49_TALSN|nr:DEAD box helicase involved in nonsense mediated decay, putative [Talaromyces stipitatus ATCC 10500]EED17574.1 DEAD box helicase involved in nonsense mediated decay, putative [Talaromyces stipitatus ATCC 10500]